MFADNIQACITFLKTRDLVQTHTFYTQVLGMPEVLDQRTCKIYRAGPSAYVGFCLTDEYTGSSEVILTFVVEDVDNACRCFEEVGIQIEVQPRFNPQYNIYQFFMRDPNGYLIEVQHFHDPAWEGEGDNCK